MLNKYRRYYPAVLFNKSNNNNVIIILPNCFDSAAVDKSLKNVGQNIINKVNTANNNLYSESKNINKNIIIKNNIINNNLRNTNKGININIIKCLAANIMADITIKFPLKEY